jgi:hypothetical protein
MIKKFMDSKAPGWMLVIFSVCIFGLSIANCFIKNNRIQTLIWILLFMHLTLLILKQLYDYNKLSEAYLKARVLNLRFLKDVGDFYDYVYLQIIDENIKKDIEKKFTEIIENR